MEVYESIVFVIGYYPDNKCVCFSLEIRIMYPGGTTSIYVDCFS